MTKPERKVVRLKSRVAGGLQLALKKGKTGAQKGQDDSSIKSSQSEKKNKA